MTLQPQHSYKILGFSGKSARIPSEIIVSGHAAGSVFG